MSSETRNDDGVGLIEIVVAMLLLAVLAVGVLPLLLQATTASVVNRDLVTANSVATDELAPVRAGFPNSPANAKTCAALAALQHAKETRTGGLFAERTVTCSGVGTGTVVVKVFRGTEAKPLVTVATKVMVSG